MRMTSFLQELPGIKELLDDARNGSAPALAAVHALEGLVHSANKGWANKTDDWESIVLDNLAKWARGDVDEDKRWKRKLDTRHPRRGMRKRQTT